MLKWAVILLVLALIAGALGFSGVMSAAVNVAWVLAVIAVILFVIGAITGRRVA